ncbi:hypothetical protein CKM354_001236500 [Cercospora kikuchii]|uniref:Uncharacterized protein n=1 Tax=Cercospora kikuchii TaxID=84275 RepID=A0A9P3L1S3_9PEZI|nr:uncharacterized protein CKM354_001236500 [Cercospora kikuchii]GIZ49333.1 hypothetical protein CKM354_001236500 [Cercospora kikuchii]
MHSLFASRLIALLAAVPGIAAYVCSDFGCNGIANYINAQCGVDPNDASLHGDFAQFCLCQPANLALAVTYTGLNQAVTTESSTTSVTSTSVVTSVIFAFTGTNRNIQSGSPVTLNLNLGGQVYPALSYTYSPVTSNYYTDTTATVPTTTSSVTTTTTTATVTSTTTIAQITSTQLCTTGTITVTGDTSTTTTTSTITPTVKTKKKIRVSITTVRASCIGKPTGRPYYPRNLPNEYPPGLAKRQSPVNAGVVEIPWCPLYLGNPQPTTYTTATVFTTTTATTTDTSTDIATTTETATETPTPLTTTVCSDVDATETTTPTTTATAFTTAPQSTTTLTRTYVYTVTVYPRYPKPCSTPRPKYPNGSGCKLTKPKKKKHN